LQSSPDYFEAVRGAFRLVPFGALARCTLALNAVADWAESVAFDSVTDLCKLAALIWVALSVSVADWVTGAACGLTSAACRAATSTCSAEASCVTEAGATSAAISACTELTDAAASAGPGAETCDRAAISACTELTDAGASTGPGAEACDWAARASLPENDAAAGAVPWAACCAARAALAENDAPAGPEPCWGVSAAAKDEATMQATAASTAGVEYFSLVKFLDMLLSRDPITDAPGQ
jgi:hypothetical protein